ncbi:hypothetical protein [Natronorubrum halophilum]|uniref:hypothetical protein n=1 Tax=Natronorubrum halophilum TaxID=1702106 RepID=UPI001EE85885|nr:hypothetical protein [Natronorubrum halophilum]
MTGSNLVASHAPGDRDSGAPDTAFQVIVAIYSGALLAGLATIAATLTGAVPADSPLLGALTTTYAVGFVIGTGAGVALSSVDPHLPRRLGRTLLRRLALVAPVVFFVGVWLAPLEATVDVVAVWSTIAVLATGYALSQLASNRYVDAVTPGDPEETWRWDPPGSVRLDAALFALYAVLGAGNAASGNWLQALVWLTVGVAWIANSLAEGRWSFGPRRTRCEVQFYDAGLVKRRPYTRSFVPRGEITHARLRDGELALDRGLRDVRFDRDELEDPEAVLEAVDRRLARNRS